MSSAEEKQRILIRNIYYMLAYAFQALHTDAFRSVETEPFENIHDLFAAILSKGIGQQLKQGLYRTYVGREDDLPVLRGQINFPGTIQNQIAHRQQLRCVYDEFSENNLLNQILKTTAQLLLQSADVRREYRRALRKELLFFGAVDTVDPRSIPWAALRFQKNNQTYQMLLGICQLVLQGLLLTETDGRHKLAAFLDEQRMCRLYEKFLLAYFKREHPELRAAAAQIPWALDGTASAAMPIMQSDISLQKGNRMLIIDAKYYARNMQIHYDRYMLHSQNVYQIYTYVKNKACVLERAGEQCDVAGMLLYAKTTDPIQPNGDFQLHGNRFFVRTLDLYAPFTAIRAALDEIAAAYFG